MQTLCDPSQPVGAVPGGVQPGDIGQKRLCRADVAGGLLASDVLLARLEGETKRRSAGTIGADADESTRKRAGVLVRRRDEGGVRPSEAHRETEPLCRADHDVGSETTGRLEKDESHRIGSDGDDESGLVPRAHEFVGSHDATRGRRVREENSESRRHVHRFDRPHDEIDSERDGTSAQDPHDLRMGVGVDKEGIAGVLRNATGHCHRLGGGRGFVEK